MRPLPRSLVSLALLVSTVTTLGTAQHIATDSASTHHEKAGPVLRVWEGVLLAGLTGGAFAIDQRIRNDAQEDRTTFSNHAADVGNALGNGVYIYPTLLVGTLAGKAFGSKGLEGVSWRALESTAFAGGGVLVLKSMIGRRRPNVRPDDPFSFQPFKFKDNSFPSGHTAVAFALATSFAHETRDHWSDAAFYALASLTGFARINNDMHWLSDTIFGAGVGIMSARLVERMHRKLILGPGVVGASFAF